MNNFQTVWLEIADHIKDEFVRKFGYSKWYKMFDEAKDEETGLDLYKRAVSELAK
jgi:hypothetical protein